MRDKRTGAAAAQDPDSPINRALADWDCDIPEGLKPEHVSEGIRAVKITKAKVGSEARKAPARKNPEMVRKIGKFNVRYLPAGKRSRVEFYDSRYKDGFGELGQFVTRYYARDILESPAGPLALDLGIPEWSINAAEKERVREMIARSGDFGPVLNPAKRAAKPAAKVARGPAIKLYAVRKIGMRAPIAVFSVRSDAVEFGQNWANIHNAPVQVVEQ